MCNDNNLQIRTLCAQLDSTAKKIKNSMCLNTSVSEPLHISHNLILQRPKVGVFHSVTGKVTQATHRKDVYDLKSSSPRAVCLTCLNACINDRNIKALATPP